MIEVSNTTYISEPELSFTLECTNSISWQIFLDSNRLIFSDNFETMYGIRQADYSYRFGTFLDRHLNPHKEQILESIDLYYSGEADCVAIGEITLSDDKNRTNWLHARGKSISGNQKVIYGVSVDITQRKKLEEKLAEKECAEWHSAINELKKSIFHDEFSKYLHLFANETTDSVLPPAIIKGDAYKETMAKLSKREREVIVALLAGNVRQKDLSNALNISLNTVKTHLKHIYQATGAPNIPALLSLLHSGKC